MDPKCETCLFVSKGEVDQNTLKAQYTCWRYPPTTTPIAVPTAQGLSVQVIASRPVINPEEDYCGEYATQVPNT